ncbi:4Fe-4S binding protein [Stygiolobus caldivivus]|uniref:4Fe-4S ferredoxin n=1 Tax=Stygiolobus caldivivus TaxID=2824673 RepID=A0A8D5ZIF6_9CREN|nr:4Fe-4S binding protein [Stygiolobus caldivivus]BCU69571.1 4Fe-4S ferredoxin [Stygiolobus caldivivus]
MSDALTLSLIIALSMLAVVFYTVYEVERWKSRNRVLISLYLQGMMLTMNLGGYLYLVYHSAFLFLIINGAYMFFALYPILTFKGELQRKEAVYIPFSILMVVSEAVMGALIYTLQTGLPSTLNDAINNVWFVGVMVSEMVFTLAIKRNVDPTLRKYLIAMLLLMPWFPSVAGIYSFYASAFIMIAATIVVYETLYNQRLRATQDTFTVIELMTIFAFMMIGEFVYFLIDTLTLFDVSMAVAMFWFILRTLSGPNPKRGNYLRDATLAFAIIFTTFVMEFFMGAVLDFLEGVFTPGVAGFISSLSLPWLSPNTPWDLLWDGIDIVGSVLGSTWFLIMMGIEMGFLAFKKMLEIKVREVRVRMVLMIIAYAIYSVYLPNFSPIASQLAYIPYMWSMGVGTMGGVTNAFLMAIIGTYVIYGVLSFLFGSRNLCGVTCTAPLMYQGNFYDSLKVYNRTSKLGKKTMTSKSSKWYRGIALGISLLVLVASIISYLSNNGVLPFTVEGVDITVLIYFIAFDIVWYIVFISIPFMGTFACVTQGWCYWGVFNQAISRVGLFRLKVRDPQVCVTCKTVDCANACPTGITDMRGEFIKKGEMRSIKCVGIGECVDACPHKNIFFYDVRHVISNLFKGRNKGK